MNIEYQVLYISLIFPVFNFVVYSIFQNSASKVANWMIVDILKYLY